MLCRTRKFHWYGVFCPERPEIGVPQASFRNFSHYLTRLEHFRLTCTLGIPLPPCESGLFSAFKDTLSRITLCYCLVSEKDILGFIDYFPNLEHLSLFYPSHTIDTRGLSSSSPRQLRKLLISPGFDTPPNFLPRLSKLGLSVDKVVIPQ